MPRNKVTTRAKQISSKASQHTTASGVAHTNRETETEHGGHRAETSSYSRDGVKAGTDDVTVAEVYGFVGWVATGLAYACYLLWAFLPEPVLRYIHVTYYPSKYWAVAVPAYVCVLVGFVVVAYIALNLIITPALSSAATLQDEHSKVASHRMGSTAAAATPDFADLPITLVNQFMYED